MVMDLSFSESNMANIVIDSHGNNGILPEQESREWDRVS